jgi:hypothetical protein
VPRRPQREPRRDHPDRCRRQCDPLAGLASNPLLKGFLDSDGDEDVDMTDLVNLGSKFLK